MLSWAFSIPRPVQISTIPIVTIFVRHAADCPRKHEEFHKTCRCSKHLPWSYGGEQFRRSARTRSWGVAEETKREIEAKFKDADSSKPVETITVAPSLRKMIEKATQSFVSDKRSQGVNADVLKKYERELGRFTDFSFRTK